MDKKNRKPQVDTIRAAELFEKLPAADQAALLSQFDSETAQFLQIAWNPLTRPNLLDRLQALGELSAFQAAENGTSCEAE